MASEIEASELVARITPTPGVVVMMCGIAGSGKTTFAKRLEAKGFIRLSIDEEIWQRFGKYGMDYDAATYPQYQDVARASLRQRLVELLDVKQPTVIDFSFWSRSSRDDYKRLIVEHGCMWKLMYLRATPDLLRRRLAERNQRFDANAAFPITEDILTSYVSSFEAPQDEGEIIVF